MTAQCHHTVPCVFQFNVRCSFHRICSTIIDLIARTSNSSVVPPTIHVPPQHWPRHSTLPRTDEETPEYSKVLQVWGVSVAMSSTGSE